MMICKINCEIVLFQAWTKISNPAIMFNWVNVMHESGMALVASSMPEFVRGYLPIIYKNLYLSSKNGKFSLVNEDLVDNKFAMRLLSILYEFENLSPNYDNDDILHIVTKYKNGANAFPPMQYGLFRKGETLRDNIEEYSAELNMLIKFDLDVVADLTYKNFDDGAKFSDA